VIDKPVLKKIKALEIRTRYFVESMLAGGYQSAFKGHGLNFSDIRPYQVGDDVRFIDWKVTAKTGGTPFVKVFQEERELTVMLLVDISGSQDFGSGVATKRDVAIELAAALGFSAIKNQDNVGLILFSDRIEQYVPPKKGKTHVLRMIRDLFVAKPVGKKTDIAAALAYLLRVQKKKTIVFVISDFIDDGYERLLRIAAQRHDVVPIVLSDPHELVLPRVGVMAVEDAESGAVSYVSTGNKALREWFSNQMQTEMDDRARLFRTLNVTALTVPTSVSAIDALVRFFKRRAGLR